MAAARPSSILKEGRLARAIRPMKAVQLVRIDVEVVLCRPSRASELLRQPAHAEIRRIFPGGIHVSLRLRAIMARSLRWRERNGVAHTSVQLRPAQAGACARP
jgi:hypothetical protein